jgi:hypothetical protein
MTLWTEWTGVVLSGTVGSFDRQHSKQSSESSEQHRRALLSCLALTAHVVDEQWADEQVYAAFTEATVNNTTLPEALELAWTMLDSTSESDVASNLLIKSALLVTWTTVCKALFRLQHVHMDSQSMLSSFEAPSHHAVKFAYELLNKDARATETLNTTLKDNIAGTLISPEQVYLACVDCLVFHVKANHTLDDMDGSHASPLLHKLETQVARLNDVSMPMSTFVRLGLASLHLLLLLEKTSRVTDQLMEYVIEASVVVPLLPQVSSVSGGSYHRSSSMPRWTTAERIYQWTVPLLVDWSRLDRSSNTLEAIVSKFFKTKEQRHGFQVVAFGDDGNDTSIAGLVFLLRSCRTWTRRQMLQVAPQTDQSGAFFPSLLNRIRQDKSLQKALYFKTLVEDRQSIATHDELSRRVWQMINVDVVTKLIDTIFLVHSD